MLKAKTPLLVGLLMVVGAFALVYTFGSLDQGMDVDNAYTVYARFDDATGLVPNSQVKLSGIEVGRLGDIGLDPEVAGKAKVTIHLRKDIKLKRGVFDANKQQWINGATAVRRQASLIGDYYVSLSQGIAGEELGPGDVIENIVSEAGIDAVIANVEKSSRAIFPQIEAIVGDIKSITQSLKTSFGEGAGQSALTKIRGDISKTTDNVAQLTTEMRSFLKTSIYPKEADIGAILQGAQRTTDNAARASEVIAASTVRLAERLEHVLARVDKMVGSIDRSVSTVGRFVDQQVAADGQPKDGTVAKALSSLDKNMALLEGTLENVRSITSTVDQGKGTVGRLLNDDKLINDIERVIAGVEEFTSVIQRTEIRVDLRADYFARSDSFKSTIGFSLHPAPDKYYLLQLIDDPAGKTSVTRRVTTTNDPLRPPVEIEDISETTNDFKITAQFAKRIGAFTFRYGIMESTGGLGVDLDLLNDALSFKLDAFEFGRDQFPRVRVMATWEFLRNVYIAAGVDDMLNGTGRDYMLGMGVRFTDRDLLGVLPFVPSQ